MVLSRATLMELLSVTNRLKAIIPLIQTANCESSQCAQAIEQLEYMAQYYPVSQRSLSRNRPGNSVSFVDLRQTEGDSTALDMLSEGTSMLYDCMLRKWETVQPHYMDKINLRICSYNVLSQQIAERTKFLYTHLLNFTNRQHELLWNYRSKLLAKEFSMINADIFCLQEVQYDHYESFFRPIFEEAGYKGVYKRRTGPTVDGCAIFYRPNLQLLNCKDVEFVFGNQQTFNQNNIAQIARFKMPNGAEFCITNTHLVFNKRLGQVKLAQAARLLSEIYKTTKNQCPYLVCGDFNMRPGSPLYNFISNGFLSFANLRQFEVSGQGEVGGLELQPQSFPVDVNDNEGCHIAKMQADTDALVHKMKLASAYSHITNDAKPEITSFQSLEACKSDFVFYSVEKKITQPNGAQYPSILEIREGKLHLVRRLTLPDESILRSTVGPWPNFTTPSDHIPLVVEFALL